VIVAAVVALHSAGTPAVHPGAPAPACDRPDGGGGLPGPLRVARAAILFLVPGASACSTGGPESPTPPPVGPASPPSEAAPPVRYPGDLLDLRNWYLTLPTGTEGDPRDIEQPQLQTYSGEYFRLTDAQDGVVFRAPAGGVTTENSNYPRSELREMDGTEHAAWSSTTGTHVLDVRQAITEVPPVKPDVVAAQIHDGDDDILQIRLEGSTLAVQYDDGEKQVVLDDDYRLGTAYDIRIVVSDGRIAVFHNGEQKADIAQRGIGWYWKVGVYTQSNAERGDRPDAAGEVVVHSLRIDHSDG
jgi:hypothetical protein